MNDVRALFTIATLLMIIGFAAMWDFGWLQGLAFNGTVAAVLGMMLTTVLAVGLMGLMVNSSQRQDDERVRNFSRRTKIDPHK